MYEIAQVFGPVPSRRLGRSLGINNVPPKKCTYACAYCQLGTTLDKQARRAGFYKPDELISQVRRIIDSARATGESIDYLTFVPAGEPTLDIHLGETIHALKPLGIEIAVITNGSLLASEQVRAEVREADLVSVKVDTVDASIWRRINVPHADLGFDAVLRGLEAMAEQFDGHLLTETMLVDGLNSDARSAEDTAAFIGRLAPHVAYIGIPTRPPAKQWVSTPAPVKLAAIVRAFRRRVTTVRGLFGFEGAGFSASGDPERDLLSIAAVHPMRDDAVVELLAKYNANRSVVRKLVDEGELVATTYDGSVYYRTTRSRIKAPF